MNSNQFTPGPWVADANVRPWCGGEETGCMVRYWIKNGVGKLGLPIANCLDHDTQGYTVANAHLIAAAPDLLTALKTLLVEMDQWDSHGAQLARDAIAKAEGGWRIT